MNAKIIIPAILVPVAIIMTVYTLSTDEPPLPTTIQIKQDETITYRNLIFWFYDIEDSRCPSDVTCIWQGEVKAMINIRNETHKISAQFTPNHSVTYIQPYNITLTDIQPYPVSTEKADYIATLRIENTQ